MKKMNSSSRALVTTLIILVAVSLVVCVITSIFPPREDYTKDYTTYNKVSEITSTYELMDFCHSKGISYSINDGCFEMDGYRITFSLNKAECSIDNDNHMNFFYLLENGRSDDVYTNKSSDGETVKTYEIKTWGTNYELTNGCYTLYNMWPALIAFAVAVILGLLLANYLSFCRKCKGCNMYNAQNTSD